MMACDTWHPSRESLAKVDNALRLISVFSEKVVTSSKLLQAVLKSLSSSVVSGLLRQYALHVQDAIRFGYAYCHSTVNVCPMSYREARTHLHESLAVMLIKCALHAPQCGYHSDTSAMALVLDNRALRFPAQHASMGCTQGRPMNILTPKISMFEAVSTPRMDSVSLNWRDGLMKEISRDADCRYQGVIRMVGEICRDLELRCNDSERPLREEQSKTREILAKLESSERDKVDWELQAGHLKSNLNVLETERDCLADQVEATEERLKELGTSLDNIHQEFEHAKIEAERASQAAIESARQQDLVYLATMTGKDEILEEKCLRIDNAESHAKALEYELNNVRELGAENAEKLKGSETSIGILNNAVSALECRIQDLQNELIRTKEHNTSDATKISINEALIEELNSTIAAANEASDQNMSLMSTLKDQLQKAEFETFELRLQHETYKSAKDAEIGRLDESHRSLDEKCQNELETVRRSAAAASERAAATIVGLQSKVGKLRRERKVGVFLFQTTLF